MRIAIAALTLLIGCTNVAVAQPGSGWDSTFGADGIRDGQVNAMAVYDGSLFIAGNFDKIGDPLVPVLDNLNSIVRWDGSWHAVDDGLEQDTGSGRVNGTVYALMVYDGNLYAGGNFNRAGSTTVENLAIWDGTSWSAATLPSGVPSQTSYDIRDLAVTSVSGADRLWLVYAKSTSPTASHVYRATNAGATSWELEASDNVYLGMRCIEGLTSTEGHYIYVGTDLFSEVTTDLGLESCYGIARMPDTDDWDLMPAQNEPCDPMFELAGPGITTHDVEAFNGTIYVAGQGQTDAGSCLDEISSVEKWNPGTDITWTDILITDINNSQNTFHVAHAWQGCGLELLFLGGQIGEAVNQGIVAINENDARVSLGDGINRGATGSVYAIAEYDGYVYFGGGFGTAGGDPSYSVARWSCSFFCGRIDFNQDGVVDILDFLDFFDAYGECEGEPSPCEVGGIDPDLNGDGEYDILDQLDFFDLYGACEEEE